MTRTGRRFSILFAAIAALAKTGSAAARREFLRSARVLAAVALIALVGALALPGAAQAQTTTTFVSNLGQRDVVTNSYTTPTSTRAQQFETGSNSGGYTLTEIVVNIRNAQTGTPAFALHTSTAGDAPGTKVVDLSGDSSTAGEQSFTPASATTLSASTKYFIVFSMTSGQANLQRTGSNNIDSGASTGWDIAETSLLGTNSSDNSVEIAINGTAGGDTPPPLSTDATLSGLSLGTGVTLNPAFAPGTLTYAVAVGNAVDEVTVTPTTTDTNATPEFLTASDATLDDADTVKDDFQVALAVGDTVFKVQVTAEDTTTTQTYTVTVTRAAADTPTVTIAADQPAFTGRLDWVTFTLTRTGNAAAALDVAVALTQDRNLLESEDLAQTVTFGAGDATAALILFPFVSFQTVTQETTLTATVQAGSGYAPGSPNTASTRIVAADPAVTASIEEAAYTFAEDATVAVILRTATGVPSPNTDILVVLSTEEIPGQAVSNVDYTGFSLFLTFQPSDFTSDGAAFTACQEVTLAIVDDLFEEPDETVTLALEPSPGTPEVVALRQADGTACQTSIRCDVTVTATTTEFLDASDTALDDADDVANGHQVALAVGDTVFKVQVTAEDGTTTQTYTVTVTRAAQAQTTTTFVSNTGESRDRSAASIMAQSFTAGSNPDGYTLSDVALVYQGTSSAAEFTVTRVKIRKDNAGAPGDLVANLLSPATFSVGILSFAAPANTTLEAGETYWVVINEGYSISTERMHFDTTFSDDQTVTTADPNWSIADTRLWKNTDTASWESPSARAVMLAVNGTATDDTPPPPSTDATLSGLSLGTGVTLDPAFAPGTTSYTAAVGNAVDEVTVTATTTDTNATPEFLDASDTTLDDADDVANGHQVALAVGDTVFKVQVTAEDGTTTQTYTVTVTRAAAGESGPVAVVGTDAGLRGRCPH